MAEKWEKDPTLTVKEALSSQISIIGENMNIRRFEQVEEADGFVASYIHGGGKIGVLVDVVTDVVNDAVKEMARNVAMQIAALKPQYTSRNEISADFIEHAVIYLVLVMILTAGVHKLETRLRTNER